MSVSDAAAPDGDPVLPPTHASAPDTDTAADAPVEEPVKTKKLSLSEYIKRRKAATTTVSTAAVPVITAPTSPKQDDDIIMQDAYTQAAATNQPAESQRANAVESEQRELFEFARAASTQPDQAALIGTRQVEVTSRPRPMAALGSDQQRRAAGRLRVSEEAQTKQIESVMAARAALRQREEEELPVWQFEDKIEVQSEVAPPQQVIWRSDAAEPIDDSHRHREIKNNDAARSYAQQGVAWEIENRLTELFKRAKKYDTEPIKDGAEQAAVNAVMMSCIWYADMLSIGMEGMYASCDPAADGVTALLIAHAELHSRHASAFQGIHPMFDFLARTRMRYWQEKLTSPKFVDLELIHHHHLRALHLAKDTSLRPVLAASRVQLRELICTIEDRFHQEASLSHAPHKVAPDKVENFYVWDNGSPELRESLRGKIPGLTGIPHWALYHRRINIMHDGVSAFQSRDDPNRGLRRLDLPPRTPHLHPFFTSPSPGGEPSGSKGEFLIDGQNTFPSAGWERWDTVKRKKPENHPCAFYADGHGHGNSGRLGFKADLTSNRPNLRVTIESQDPTIQIFFDSSCVLEATLDDLAVLELCILPANVENPADEKAFGPLVQEARHNWPLLEFDAGKKQQQIWAMEFELKFKPDRHFSEKCDNTAHVSDLDDEKGRIANAILSANNLSVICLVYGVLEKGHFLWFRELVSSCKAMMGGHLTSLYGYFEGTGVQNVQDMVEYLMPPKDGSSPRYAKVLEYMRNVGDGFEVMHSNLFCAAEHRAWSIEQYVKFGILSNSRSAQYTSICQRNLSAELHDARLRVEDSSLIVDLNIAPAIDPTDMSLDGVKVQLQFRGNDSPNALFAQNTSPSAQVRNDRPKTPESTACNFVLAGKLVELPDAKHRFQLISSIPEQVKDLFGPKGKWRDGTTCLFEMSVPEQFDRVLRADMESLINLLLTEPCPGRFDLRTWLSQDRMVSFTAKVVDLQAPGIDRFVARLLHGLDASQQAAMWRIQQGLVNGFLYIQGPPGTGKSAVAARAILLIAQKKKILVVAAQNKAIDSLVDDKIIMNLNAFGEHSPRKLLVCRAHPRSFVRKHSTYNVWDHRPTPPSSTPKSLAEILYGDHAKIKYYDLWLDRLVCSLAFQIVGNHDLAQYVPVSDFDLIWACTAYVRSWTECRSQGTAAVYDVFDGLSKTLSDMLVKHMDVVCSTIDHGATLSSFKNDGVIIEEISNVNLWKSTRVLAAASPAQNPEFLVCIGDLHQGGPVDRACLSRFSEFGMFMQRCMLRFIDYARPIDGKNKAFVVVLDKNYRNPPSIWWYVSEHYSAADGVRIQSYVDVQKRPYYQLVYKLATETPVGSRRAFLSGRAKHVVKGIGGHSEHASQFVWFHTNTPSEKIRLSALRSAHGQPRFRKSDLHYDTPDGRVSFQRQEPVVVTNVAATNALLSTAKHLLDAGIPSHALLIQVPNARERMYVSRKVASEPGLRGAGVRIRDDSAPLRVWSGKDSQGSEAAIVLTLISVCSDTSLPVDEITTVLMTRADTFHFVFGNADEVANHASKNSLCAKIVTKARSLGHEVTLDKVDEIFGSGNGQDIGPGTKRVKESGGVHSRITARNEIGENRYSGGIYDDGDDYESLHTGKKRDRQAEASSHLWFAPRLDKALNLQSKGLVLYKWLITEENHKASSERKQRMTAWWAWDAVRLLVNTVEVHEVSEAGANLVNKLRGGVVTPEDFHDAAMVHADESRILEGWIGKDERPDDPGTWL